MASSETNQQGALLFVDFIPKEPRKPDRQRQGSFDVFGDLVDRANYWLTTHPENKVVSCETVIIYGTGKRLLVDSHKTDFTLFTDSDNCFRLDGWAAHALRVWYKQRPSYDTAPVQVLGFVTISPRAWSEGNVFSKQYCEPLMAASENFNEHLSSGNFCIGKVLNVNTCTFWLYHRAKADPNQVFYSLSTASYQVEFMRVFYEVGQPGPTNVRYADFIPACVKKRGMLFGNLVFESYDEVFSDVQKWVNEGREKNKLQVINLETVTSIVDNIARDGSFSEKKLPFPASSINDVIYFIRVHYIALDDVANDDLPPPYPDRFSSLTLVPKQVSRGGFMKFPKYESVPESLSRLTPDAAQAVGQGRLVGINSVPMPINYKYPPYLDKMYSSSIEGAWLKTVRLFWTQ